MITVDEALERLADDEKLRESLNSSVQSVFTSENVAALIGSIADSHGSVVGEALAESGVPLAVVMEIVGTISKAGADTLKECFAAGVAAGLEMAKR